ncbi:MULTISPECIES: hypothetical protein [unclassified Pseudoxanthomonas]|uniref:hypothetical protein n=1 Tax=unclassified Pseudoxanthomonas TaxID=2645906 RepID=UPI0008EC4530|nr:MULTISPECIES: hypothetical protein [unclassified Pseudoxanthomonas]PPJ42319.1 hypothetical protein C0063_03240 [Pseudoxanthomonas sp. KAs_5_3]SFV27769.1 hypothetical protein SAMN05428990_0782 [Pseudoxanthomonas sp. YR558]
MYTQFNVELWVNTIGIVPESRVSKTVDAADHYAAVREARKRVQEENPDINLTKIDTWFTDISLE